jgi:hypothetical protein
MKTTFEWKNGSPDTILMKVADAVKVTVGDCLTVGIYIKEQCLDRTMRGVDVDGVAFAPYSRKGPYYYYPSPLGKHKQRKAAVNRLLRITRDVSEGKWEAHFKAGRDMDAEKSSVGGVKTRSGLGIKFESYADFKESLGRFGVDLTGPRAPHMLQELTVRAGGTELKSSDPVGPRSRMESCDEVAIGIYDPVKAAIARGHQNGSRKLPQRRFLGATQTDMEQAARLLSERLRDRILSGVRNH